MQSCLKSQRTSWETHPGGALQATMPGGQRSAGRLGVAVLGGGAVGRTDGSGSGARQGQTQC